MPDPTVARFRRKGRVSLWRYHQLGKNWDGWHFAADDEGCRSLQDLLDLMETARYPSRVTFRLADPPRAVLNVPNRRVEKARPAKTWTWIYPKEAAEPDTWELSGNTSNVTLRFGSGRLERLRTMLEDSLEGNGDYSIGSDEGSSEALSVWWWVRGA